MKKTLKMTYDTNRVSICDGNGGYFEIPECCGRSTSPIVGKAAITWYCMACQEIKAEMEPNKEDGFFLKMKVIPQTKDQC